MDVEERRGHGPAPYTKGGLPEVVRDAAAPYRHLARSPHGMEVPCPPQPPLPWLAEPRGLPLLGEDCGELLLAVAHPRIVYLQAYRQAGFSEAPDRCLLRLSVAERLTAAGIALPHPFGLAVFDGWRPVELQRRLAAAIGDSRYVADADDPATAPAPHTSGGAVDLTLSFAGVPLSLGTGFDEFVPAAATTALEDRPGPERDLRRLLYWTLTDAGFAPYPHEWWHFEYGTRRWAAVTGGRALYGERRPREGEVVAGSTGT